MFVIKENIMFPHLSCNKIYSCFWDLIFHFFVRFEVRPKSMCIRGKCGNMNEQVLVNVTGGWYFPDRNNFAVPFDPFGSKPGSNWLCVVGNGYYSLMNVVLEIHNRRPHLLEPTNRKALISNLSKSSLVTFRYKKKPSIVPLKQDLLFFPLWFFWCDTHLPFFKIYRIICKRYEILCWTMVIFLLVLSL